MDTFAMIMVAVILIGGTVFGFWLSFLPTFVSSRRKHPERRTIFWLNMLVVFGPLPFALTELWMIGIMSWIGWFALIVWAFSAPKVYQIILPNGEVIQ